MPGLTRRPPVPTVSRLMLQRLYLLALLLVAAPAVIAAIALAEPAPSAPADGVLLLRSGRVLAGKIRRDGTRYVVSLPAGEIRIRAEDVEHVSATLQGGYEYKRATILPGSAGPHLDLAAWCIAQGLWAEARRELDDARRLEPRHPKIPLLERRLTTDQRTASQPAPADAPATATEPGETKAEDESEAPDVPKAVVDAFAASVQPILQNHCSAAACHGPTTTSSFRLVRHPYGRPIARTTHENLRAVLELVDREHPSQSPLLMTPIKPHGRMREAVFKPRDTARYRQLVAWVQQVAGGSTGLAAKPGPDQQPPLLQQAEEAEPPRKAPQQSPPSSVKPAGFRVPTPEQDRSPSPGFIPRDAFDPEIFNRRHFPGRR